MSTITRPTITEAMTPAGLRAACNELWTILGGKGARVSCIVASDNYDCAETVALLVYPPKVQNGHILHAKSWPEVFAAGAEWASAQTLMRRNDLIKRMAFKIMELTDELGSCPEARLRAADFTHDEIVEFHEVACERAAELCRGAPLVVIMEAIDA